MEQHSSAQNLADVSTNAAGYLCLVLHAHLPFVRHPEHEDFLEERWLFEAAADTYLPLLEVLRRWEADLLPVRLTLTLTPTLCAMLQDGLLQERCARHISDLVRLAEKEAHRTLFLPEQNRVAMWYLERFQALLAAYDKANRDLISVFRGFQNRGRLDIITSAATHAFLPLLADDSASLRAQVLTGRDYYEACFGCAPRGIWLPECGYAEGVEPALQEAGLRWFITDTHGLLNARPKPRYAVFAPIITPAGLAVFGRDFESAKQVWSRHEGYPGDPRYREFYRDIGYDLEYEYLRPHLSAPEQRGFTGLKYYRITGGSRPKEVYDPRGATEAAHSHAEHFLVSRIAQVQKLGSILGRPPVILSPYDAELFGHWWYEGIEFLDKFVRLACRDTSKLQLITPEDYLRIQPQNQLATPAASSWGEEGYSGVWLNEKNHWMQPHLRVAQHRMVELVRRPGAPAGVEERALKQAGRELLLAQSSDWPFIIRTGTSPGYARQRFTEHLLRFTRLYEQLSNGVLDEDFLTGLEARDNIFPDLKWQYWRGKGQEQRT